MNSMATFIKRTWVALATSAIFIAGLGACSEESQVVSAAACQILNPAADSINSAAKDALKAVADNPDGAAQGLKSATETVKNVQEKLPTNLRSQVNDVTAMLEDLTELAENAAGGADLSPERVEEFNTRIDDATETMVDFCS